ncbi:hypothetical protein JG688_00001485 [Phytophthora aleatoria]|uniref:Uncharacterized protein n=1 Tax=Phytophthora aleatoria TaxID=2496075 RepID=A0A8J5MIY4_9STRA|nr:hypothetical protein JG688_00001485 [Phytophthora aleatoria]
METDRQTVAICTICADFIRSQSAVEIARRGLQEIYATFKEKEPPYAGSCRIMQETSRAATTSMTCSAALPWQLIAIREQADL